MLTRTVQILMAPGPVRVPQSIRDELSFDPPYFTSSEFSDLLARIQPKLRSVFGTKLPVMIGTGSGTMGMEASVSNFFNPGDIVVVVDTGKYGSNWAEICSRYGLGVRIVKPERYGSCIETSQLERVLTDSPARGLFVTHVETTTGVKNPIDLYAAIARQINPDTLVIVDCVSSLLTEFVTAEYFDVVISASQKGLQLPPGLFFMSCSRKAYLRAESSTLPRFYFDVNIERRRAEGATTTFTPASDLVKALDVALTEILHIGVANVIRRVCEVSKHVRSSLKERFEMFSTSPCNAVTAVYCEDSNQFLRECYKYKRLVLGSGLRELSDKIFRFGHFGWDIREWEVELALEIIARVHDGKKV